MGKIKLALALIIFLMLLHSAGARDEEGMQVVPAQEILDKIERGEPVEYDHVIVEGDLDLGKIELPRRRANWAYEKVEIIGILYSQIVSSSIRIRGSIIDGNVYFNNTIFNNSFDFSGSYFRGNARFSHSAFNKSSRFRYATFNSYADFSYSIFNGSNDFGHSVFSSNAMFFSSVFNSDAYFGYSAFNGSSSFFGSAFKGDANFQNSAFNSDASFLASTFSHQTIFSNAVFNNEATFWDSAFRNDVEFKNSSFNGNADFFGSVFNISDFSSTTFNRQVSFNNANFNNTAIFNDSRFKENPFFEGTFFNGPLYLTRAKYDRLFVRWKNIKELGYDDTAYLTLLENFKRLGYVEDYDACYYEYRRLHRDQPWSGRYHAMEPQKEWMLKRMDLGLQVFYGYGKEPILPLFWSIFTIVLFSLVWRIAGVNGGRGRGGIFERFSQGGEKKRKTSLEEQLIAFRGALLFSTTLFLSGTRLFVDPPAMPKLEGWFAAKARAFYIAERVLGAFFSILFFLAVSGTVVK